MKIHEGTSDELEATARLPVLDEPDEHCDPGETGTWSGGEGAFAQFGSAQRGALQAEIAARDARADQLQARLDESEAWARQLALELERLRAAQGANPQAEARLAEALTQRAHWEAAAGEAWAQLAESETAAGEVRAQLTEAETAAGEVRAQLTEAEAAASEARSQLALSQAAVGAIRAELQRAVDERDAVRAQLDHDHAELERLHAAAKPADAAAPGTRGGGAAALRREIRSQQLRIETLLEQLRSQEALRRFSGDLSRARDAGAETAQVDALRQQVVELELRIASADSAAATALDRARIAEDARTHVEASALGRQQELESRITILEESVVASARELETLRQREQHLADELMAARQPQPAAATAAPALADGPRATADGDGALDERTAALTVEIERRDHRIHALEVEIATQADALQAIRRGLRLLGGERLPAVGDPDVAPRWLTRLDDGSNRLHVLRTARCTVGRTPHSDVEVPESYVSRSHAVFKLGPDATIVEDAGSANGVFVNDVRVRRQLLKDGDSVGFGKARYRFHTQHPSD